MPRSRENGGFTLVELLIVVAIIGIVAAIAVPNLLNALDRSKQKRTMGDLRAIGAAIEAYSVDQSFYPTASDLSSLRTMLEPHYIREIPLKDAWTNEVVSTTTATDYTLGSQGKDGSGGLVACATTPRCGNVDDAIIYSNGQFIQWPEGTQQN